MERVLSILILIICISCVKKNGCIENQVKVDLDTLIEGAISSVDFIIQKQDSLQTKEYNEEIIQINFNPGLKEADSICFNNMSKKTKVVLTDSKFKVNQTNFDLHNIETDTIRQYLDILIFDPEFGMIIAELIGKQKDGFLIKSGNDTLFLVDNKYISTVTLADFLIKNRIALKDFNPPRIEPNDSSTVIEEDFNMYSFDIIEKKGNWLRIKCDTEVHGFDCTISGWAQLKIDGLWAIEIEYGY
jgi:hypothetical protein